MSIQTLKWRRKRKSLTKLSYLQRIKKTLHQRGKPEPLECRVRNTVGSGEEESEVNLLKSLFLVNAHLFKQALQ